MGSIPPIGATPPSSYSSDPGTQSTYAGAPSSSLSGDSIGTTQLSTGNQYTDALKQQHDQQTQTLAQMTQQNQQHDTDPGKAAV